MIRLRERYKKKIETWQHTFHEWHICYLLIELAERYHQDHSAKEFAEFVGLHPSVLSRWFNEKKRWRPQRAQILKMAQHISVYRSAHASLTLQEINRLLKAISEEDISVDELQELEAKAISIVDGIHPLFQKVLDETTVRNLLEQINALPEDGQNTKVIAFDHLLQAGITANPDQLTSIIDELMTQPSFRKAFEREETEEQGQIKEWLVIKRTLSPEEIDQIVEVICKTDLSSKRPQPGETLETFKTHISALDRLLGGGFQIPLDVRGKSQGLTIVLSGPPGAGKSTLALLLCIAWAKQQGHSLYCALEQTADGLAYTANAFDCFTEDQTWCWLQEKNAGKSWPEVGAVKVTELISSERTFISQIQELENHLKGMRRDQPGLVVIDSLNVLTDLDLFRSQLIRLKNLLARRGIISIFILESRSPTIRLEATEEFMADIVIVLNITFEQEYLLRTLEIKKARYQFHILGKHIMKIHSRANTGPDLPIGILIFPSLHFRLYEARQNVQVYSNPDQTETEHLDIGIPHLDQMLGDGLKQGSTTALLGPVGNLKKALALTFLAQGLHKREHVMLFTLAAEPEAALQLPIFIDDKRIDLNEYKNKGMLKVKEFRPGFIPPEEFVSQIVEGIQIEGKRITRVVFDSIAHLPLSFPLVAASKIFLPTLIDIFKLRGITSMFIGVTEEDGYDALNRGLIIRADNAFLLGRTPNSYQTQFQILKLAGQLGDHRPRLIRNDERNRIVITEVS